MGCPRCRGEALPRPPAPWARQCIVTDTSRPTRSADQPSARLHDRPAVNGRAQSPSRLKPADPHGACTQPIDPGAWAPHSPLQGACGLSPGLQPRAFAADRPGSHGRGTAAPFGVGLPPLPGRRVRHRLPSTGRGRWRRLGASVRRTGGALTCPCRGDAPARPPGWEPGNRLCALLPRYSERPSRRRLAAVASPVRSGLATQAAPDSGTLAFCREQLGSRDSRRSCGRVHTMRTISPWQSAAHDPAGDGIRNAGGRGTRRLPADWCFTGLRDPRAPPRGASPAQRAIDDSLTFRSAALPSSSCPPCLPGRGPPEGARLAPRVSGRQRKSERRMTRSRPYRPVTSGPSCRWREGVRPSG
jgi:hypothetical protein